MTRTAMYSFLGLPDGAELDEVKRSYRTLAKRLHPDLSGDDATRAQFERVSDAYERLVELLSAGKVRRAAADVSVDIFSVGQVVERGSSVAARTAAIRTLADAGKRSAYPFLRKALYDKNSLIVREAVRAIGTLRIRQSAGELAALFTRADLSVKTEVLGVAARMGDGGAFLSIIEMGLSDSDSNVRRMSRTLYAKRKRTE
ncbi:MAG TPA: DnaJ domain-containing protein [Spirochaetia bacterium]|nr:DnaJ domain-containing protein [Spirochaetia bacterium]